MEAKDRHGQARVLLLDGADDFVEGVGQWMVARDPFENLHACAPERLCAPFGGDVADGALEVEQLARAITRRAHVFAGPEMLTGGDLATLGDKALGAPVFIKLAPQSGPHLRIDVPVSGDILGRGNQVCRFIKAVNVRERGIHMQQLAGRG